MGPPAGTGQSSPFGPRPPGQHGDGKPFPMSEMTRGEITRSGATEVSPFRADLGVGVSSLQSHDTPLSDGQRPPQIQTRLCLANTGFKVKAGSDKGLYGC